MIKIENDVYCDEIKEGLRVTYFLNHSTYGGQYTFKDFGDNLFVTNPNNIKHKFILNGLNNKTEARKVNASIPVISYFDIDFKSDAQYNNFVKDISLKGFTPDDNFKNLHDDFKKNNNIWISGNSRHGKGIRLFFLIFNMWCNKNNFKDYITLHKKNSEIMKTYLNDRYNFIFYNDKEQDYIDVSPLNNIVLPTFPCLLNDNTNVNLNCDLILYDEELIHKEINYDKNTSEIKYDDIDYIPYSYFSHRDPKILAAAKFSSNESRILFYNKFKLYYQGNSIVLSSFNDFNEFLNKSNFEFAVDLKSLFREEKLEMDVQSLRENIEKVKIEADKKEDDFIKNEKYELIINKNINNINYIDNYYNSILESDNHTNIKDIFIIVSKMFYGNVFNSKLKSDFIFAKLNSAIINNKNIKGKDSLTGECFKLFLEHKDKPITKEDIKLNVNIVKMFEYINSRGTNNTYIRVGDDYYKMAHNNDLIYRKRQTLVDDYGNDFLYTIKKYDRFINEPNNINYKRIINNEYNLYSPFIHIPKEGKFDTIIKLLKHIFGEQIEHGLDYLQLIYTNPKIILPILCIVSLTQSTGKTTFLDFLSKLFKNNAAIIGSEDFSADFNDYYISKLLIMIDESDLNKSQNSAKMKMMATQKNTFRKAKFRDAVPIDFFGKIIIASNNETNFINIKQDDIRYWVRKIKKIEIFDNSFEQKLEDEIPAFVYYLKNRLLNTPTKQSRAWFKPEDLNTEDLELAKEQGGSELYFELKESINEWFRLNNNHNNIICTISDIQKILLNNNPKYSIKYIKTVMSNEFKLNNDKSIRAIPTFYPTNNPVVGKYYEIPKP